MIKLLLTFSILLLSVPWLQGQGLSGDSWAEVQKNGSGKIEVIYYPTPGLVERLEDQSMKGMCVDVLSDFEKYIETKYGKKISFEYSSEAKVWTQFLADIESAQSGVLGVANTTITSDRMQRFDFSPSFINNPLMLLTHKNAPDLDSFQEMSTSLVGYHAKVVTGSVHVGYMQDLRSNYFPDLKIKYGSSGRSVLAEIALDERQFTIVDFTEFFYAIKEKMPIKRQKLPVADTEDQLALVMPKGSDWKPIWDDFLSEDYKSSVRYKEIVANNLGRQFFYLIQ